MAYSITFTTQFSLNTDPALQPGQTRLKVVITAVTGFTDKGMLVFQVDPQTGLTYYSYPATPYDIDVYHYLVPAGLPFVRLASMQLTYETATLAEAAAETIATRLQQLCTDMVLLDEFSTPVTTTVSA